MIVHLRVVPGFWVAVEEVRRPELRSHPLILGGPPQRRGVVREASFAAQRRGIQPGMALSQAYQQCPDGIFLMPDLPKYETAWGAVCDILRVYTPLVEPLEMGQAVVDLSGCERLWGDGLEAARTISSHIHRSTGIQPWLGVASNRLVAQLASTAVGAEGIAVIDRGQEAAFLADLPLTLLPGIDPRLALTFQVLGLRTIGQLAALPAASVRQRFGPRGEQLHSHAHGIDHRPVIPPREKLSVSARRECEEGSIEEAVEAIRILADTCAIELQHRGLAGTVVELVLASARPLQSALVSQDSPSVMATNSEIRVKAVVRTPADSAPRLLETAQRLLLQYWPEECDRRLHAIELWISEFPAPRQLSFPELNRIGQTGGLAGASAERLQALAEGEQVLAARYGDASFRHLTRLDPSNILTERRFHWTSGLPWDVQ